MYQILYTEADGTVHRAESPCIPRIGESVTIGKKKFRAVDVDYPYFLSDRAALGAKYELSPVIIQLA